MDNLNLDIRRRKINSIFILIFQVIFFTMETIYRHEFFFPKASSLWLQTKIILSIVCLHREKYDLKYTSGSQIRPPFLWTYVLSMNKRAHSVTCTVQSRDKTNSFILSHSTMHRQGINNLWTWHSFVHKILKTSKKKRIPCLKVICTLAIHCRVW